MTCKAADKPYVFRGFNRKAQGHFCDIIRAEMFDIFEYNNAWLVHEALGRHLVISREEGVLTAQITRIENRLKVCPVHRCATAF